MQLYSLVCVGPGQKPEHWFSHDEASNTLSSFGRFFLVRIAEEGGPAFAYEPRCEKTGLRGFRPGPTQT